MHARAEGLWVPLITPLDPAGAVAADALAQLADDSLAAGAAGLVALGTSGEAATLSPDERAEVAAVCAAACARHGARLMVGIGGNDTAAVARELRSSEAAARADFVLSAVPEYTLPAQEGVVRHFAALAEASPRPLIAYNVPHRTGRRLDAAGLLRLATDGAIAGVKHSAPVDDDTLTLLRGAPASFAVLGGDDALLFPLLCLGAAGGITVSAHLATEHWVGLVDHARAGRLAAARATAADLLPLAQALFAEPNPAVVKGVLHRLGRIPTPDLRLPMTAASDAAVDAALTALGAAAEG